MSLVLTALLLTTVGNSAPQVSIGARVEEFPVPQHVVGPVVRHVPKPRPRALPADVPRKPGVVILQAILGADRHVTEIKVLRGIHPALDAAAAEAVARAAFSVGTADGKPASFYCTFTVAVDPRGWPALEP